MKRPKRFTVAAGAGALALATLIFAADTHADQSTRRRGVLDARLIATGIPGAGAVAEVGDFLRGSPLHDNAAFTPFTQPGQVLDPKRVLVASTSNFGAPIAHPNEPEGAVVSLDPAAFPVAVPAAFAASGGQASAVRGAVQLYTAQSPGFLNSVKEPQAVTASIAAASLPLGISINNGNGRPWVANAPNGAFGIGNVTVLDPQGYPLAGAPSTIAGGVFAGALTNRSPGVSGMTTATLGTAILTKSPDLTGRAVFATVHADGSVAQVNVLKGVDPLAPAGTLTPFARVDRAAAESTLPTTIAREGLAFNWVPTRNLFLADPRANRLVVLDLSDDGVLFAATRREIRASGFNLPIDLAPTTREIAHGSFASNTTLGGGSDLYVLNRGDNSILRMSVGGEVLAIRDIESDVRDFRVNGIAVSSDSRTIYVTAVIPGGGGVLLAVPSFGAAPVSTELLALAKADKMDGDMSAFAGFLFSLNLNPAHGLGPLFNDRSCAGCHSSPMAGGMGLLGSNDVRMVGRRRADGAFDTLDHRGGPAARTHSIAELGVPCDLVPGIPPKASVVSPRTAMSLRGDGLLDTIAVGDILANRATQPEAVRGRPNTLPDGRIGKFGWKANVHSLIEFMGVAFRNELGVTNPLQPVDEVRGCGANAGRPEVDAVPLQATARFLNGIDPPAPAAACLNSPGAALFNSVGCATCHTPSLPGPGARQAVPLYSDLLLHDMGPALDDKMQQGSARGNEWRTAPLWRVSERGRLLHDGRALTVTDAIAAHGGQGQAANTAFAALDAAAKQSLLAFLGCI